MIDLRLTPNSEQKAYYQQIHLLQENDIVVHDRGYFSHRCGEAELDTLVSNKIHGVFRMKNLLRRIPSMFKNCTSLMTKHIL